MFVLWSEGLIAPCFLFILFLMAHWADLTIAKKMEHTTISPHEDGIFDKSMMASSS